MVQRGRLIADNRPEMLVFFFAGLALVFCTRHRRPVLKVEAATLAFFNVTSSHYTPFIDRAHARHWSPVHRAMFSLLMSE